MADYRLEPDVARVLRGGTVAGNVFQLPPTQLDRKLYERVNKALTNAGGKWKKGTGHVFPFDAAPKIAAMLASGIAVDEKKRDQSFFTPRELAESIVAMASVRGMRVLEPSAGMGAIANACRNNSAASVDCCETNFEYIQHLSRNGYAVTHADFLTLVPVDLYDRVVMNPPFTKNQDVKHVKHALKWLQPGGILVSLMMPNQNRKVSKELAEHDPEITEVERGAFKESGTTISTTIVKIEKRHA